MLNIGYKRIGLTYAEQITIESETEDGRVFYQVMKCGRPFGGIHCMRNDMLLTEAQANECKKIFC